jgi:hypothetical protein
MTSERLWSISALGVGVVEGLRGGVVWFVGEKSHKRYSMFTLDEQVAVGASARA